MQPVTFLDGRVTLIPGDCLDVLAGLPENSVDSVVCDPPYHLTSIVKRFGADGAAPAQYGKDGAYARATAGFMGQKWDGGDVAFRPETWAAVLRVMKPGAYIVAFASTRGVWRMGVAIEDAGFINHPMLAWCFATGFPKATRIKAEGYDGWRYGGQALKPAIEPIYMGQKPFSEVNGTANVLRWGTGALNIDGCRIGTDVTVTLRNGNSGANGVYGRDDRVFQRENPPGRWPANLIHDGSEEVLAAFPETASGGTPEHRNADGNRNTFGTFKGGEVDTRQASSDGSAARFFASFPRDNTQWNQDHANFAANSISLSSEAVVSALSHAVAQSIPGWRLKPESYRGLSTNVTASVFALIETLVTATIQNFERRFSQGLPPEKLTLFSTPVHVAATPRPTGIITITISLSKSHSFAEDATFDLIETNSELGAQVSACRLFYSAKADAEDRLGSKHPTVKPVSLIRYLAKLITPPNGVILDCFAGTGTTGEAAWREGFNAILIEREPEYQADIARRMDLATKPTKRAAVAKTKGKLMGAEGTPLFGGEAA